MRYLSTRGGAAPAAASAAIARGLAPDGGLYVPERFPALDAAQFAPGAALPDLAATLLAPYFDGDELAAALPEICAEALDFPVPLVRLADGPYLLELFHGPTAAFKDAGARFLAACLARLPATAPRSVLVATSGDTGGAVAAAFHGRPGVRVVLLYPAGRVSARQEAQLTAWGGNVTSLRVRGDFDDCQRLVKAAFADTALREAAGLTSANSISIGRLLPQMAWYAAAALGIERATGRRPGFVVPTGNLGNAVACLWTRHSGLPVGPLLLATNANDGLVRFLAGAPWRAAPSRATLATAMDVGDPSNLERLLYVAGSDEAARQEADAVAIDDATIEATIRSGCRRYERIWCPHTATAMAAWQQLPDAAREPPWVVIATAHPAKFEDVVEPLAGRTVPLPPALEALLARPHFVEEIGPDIAALAGILRRPPPQ